MYVLMDPAAGTGIGSGGVVGPAAGAGAAGKEPMAAAALSAGAAAAAKPALNWKNLRRGWAQALFVLGCAAAALAFFSIRSSSSRLLVLGQGGGAPTDAEPAAAALRLRDASEMLLVFAAVQVLAATTALLVPVPAARQVAVFFLSCVGWHTGYRAGRVLLMLFECRSGRVDAVVGTYYCILQVVVMLGYCVGSVIVKNSGY